MIFMLDFALILDNSILYCSNPNANPKFDIICLINQLIKSLADNQPWNIHKVILQPTATLTSEKIIIRKFWSQNGSTEMLICIIGEFAKGADFGYDVIDGIYRNLNEQFCIDTINQNLKDKEIQIKQLCESLSASLLGNGYEEILNSSAKEEEYIGVSKIIYSGISTNGLPLIAQLHDGQKIFQLGSDTKKMMITNILSGQLATIAMNAYIHAEVYLNSIEIKISTEENRFLFFYFTQFGYQNSYTLECLCTGTPSGVWNKFQTIIPQLISQNPFQKLYDGDLKGFIAAKSLFKQYLI